MSEMTDVLWEHLKTLANTAKAEYDTRNYRQMLKVDTCERLCKLGYASYQGETGPGDSVKIYAITEAGREALAKHNEA